MKTLSNGSSSRGAQMGRPASINNPDMEGLFHLYKLRMSACGAYDQYGAYWGCGDPIYHCYNDDADDEEAMFVRAASRADAKAQVREVFVNARFYK